MLPIIQLLASTFVIFTKLDVSARVALDGCDNDGCGVLLTLVAFLFKHWFVWVSKYYPAAQPMHVSF